MNKYIYRCMIEYQRESSELLIDAEAAGIYLTRPGLPILI